MIINKYSTFPATDTPVWIQPYWCDILPSVSGKAKDYDRNDRGEHGDKLEHFSSFF
jgi:hypothetical protein